MITQRINASRRVVSHYDEALAELPNDVVERYGRTLDIAELGDLSALTNRPTVFHVRPLTVDSEHLLYAQPMDMWQIFSRHVDRIDDFGAEVKWKNGRIENDCRELFPMAVVVDVASMIINLANASSDGVFFSPPGDWAQTRINWALRRAVAREKALAASVAAMRNGQATEGNTGE
jgi:hypothetical protein